MAEISRRMRGSIAAPAWDLSMILMATAVLSMRDWAWLQQQQPRDSEGLEQLVYDPTRWFRNPSWNLVLPSLDFLIHGDQIAVVERQATGE
ncbi:hypothetical protein ACFX1R_027297 [Malus domestica]